MVKAAILARLNSPLEIESIGLTPLQVGQVLVRVIVSGICGAQLHEIRGHKGNANFLPHLLGHEGYGEVVETGLGVSTVSVGDRVVMHWRPGQGIESNFPSYLYRGKTITSGKVTTLSEYSIVSENRVTVVPKEIDKDFAATLGCALSTALGVVDNQANLRLGESMAIIGCGGVGLNLIQAARLKGASKVSAIDKHVQKAQLALSIGASDFFQNISQSPDSYDVIVETTGLPHLINQALSKLSKNGRLIAVGQPPPGESLNIENSLNLFKGSGMAFRATQGGDVHPEIDFERFINLYRHGMLSVTKIITHRFSLDDINVAFEVLRSSVAGRIMIDIGE